MTPKIFALLFAWLFVVSVAFTACKDEEPDPVEPNMSATVTTPVVGTSNFTATTVVATIQGSTLSITGTAAGSNVTLSFADNGTTGIRNIAVAGPAYATYTESTNSFTGTTGTIDIDTWDTTAKTITGTFEFTAQTGVGTTKTLSEGSFAAAY